MKLNCLIFLFLFCINTVVLVEARERGSRDEKMEDVVPPVSQQNIEKVRDVKPRAKFPSKLAIAVISSERRQRLWSEDELKTVESFFATDKELKIVSDIVTIPENLLKKIDSASLRFAAAQLQSDLLFAIRTKTVNEKHPKPLSAFYLTIVGMWIFPGTQFESTMVLDAALMDVQTEYVFFTGKFEGNASVIRPTVYSSYREDMEKKARSIALEKLGKELSKALNKIRTP